jgi:hypothetical protein
MKIWKVVNAVMPATPYSGPPLPKGLKVEWPGAVKKRFPAWLFGISQRVAIAEDNINRKLGR